MFAQWDICAFRMLTEALLSLSPSSAEFPENKVHTLATNEFINVENDGEVTTR